MTPFVLLTVVLSALTAAWLTRLRWLDVNRRGLGIAAHMPADVSASSASASTRRSLGAAALLALFVVAGPALSYLWVGAPETKDAAVSPAPSPAVLPPPEARLDTPARSAAAASISAAESRVALMVDHLAERLKTRPDDADGWQTLARSYASLGRHTQAIAAFRAATRLRPNDAALLADHAFSVAVIDPRSSSSEAARLTERALQIDPNNAKALALAGTLALDRNDYSSAVRHWEQLVRVEPPGSAAARQAQASILHARRLALTPLTVTPGVASGVMAVAAFGAAPLVAGRAQVSGTVTLAPALAARAAPDDTVLVFARSPSGPRMPLAVLRKQVKDLPLRFTLDDQLATTPGAKLSSAQTVVVGARIAKSGGNTARDGDLQGLVAAVPVGRGDLRIEINEVVRMR
jgi:cytochrome c-type biogenesis protein CcmH